MYRKEEKVFIHYLSCFLQFIRAAAKVSN